MDTGEREYVVTSETNIFRIHFSCYNQLKLDPLHTIGILEL